MKGLAIWEPLIQVIHILTTSPISVNGFSFCSFSEGWQSCITDFFEKGIAYAYKAAILFSKQYSFPVLYFSVFDSEELELCILQNGKRIAQYTDEKGSQKLSLVSDILGYPSGYKKRLSHILSCGNTDYKIQLLEEYFGVCLLPFPECPKKDLVRKRDDAIYRDYMENEKAISGKRAPITAQLLSEHKGKLFWDHFGSHTQKEHCFLFGYSEPKDNLSPVRFASGILEPITREEFAKNRSEQNIFAPCFRVDYGNPDCHVTFLAGSPDAFIDKTIALPRDFYPLVFALDGHLLLYNRSRICIINNKMQIIAKISVKGEIADLADDCILTTVGDSFCGYEYDPKACVRIYRFIHKTY